MKTERVKFIFIAVCAALCLLFLLFCSESGRHIAGPGDGGTTQAEITGAIDSTLSDVLDYDEITVYVPGAQSSVDENGAFTVNFMEDESDTLQTAVLVIMQGNVPVLFSYAFSDPEENPLGSDQTLGAQSTALALVMMNPLFMGATSEEKASIAEMAVNDASFSELVDGITTGLAEDALTFLDNNSDYDHLYDTATDIAITVFNNITTAQGKTSKPSLRTGSEPYIEAAGSGQLRFTNPQNIYFGVGIYDYDTGASVDRFLLNQCQLSWWCHVAIDKTINLAEGDYIFDIYKGYNFDILQTTDVLSPTHPSGLGTLSNTARLILNVLEVAGTDLVDNDKFNKLVDNINRLSGLNSIGQAMIDGDVAEFFAQSITFLDDNLEFLILLMLPDIDLDDMEAYIGEITKKLAKLAGPLKVKNAIDKLIFVKDLITASGHIQYRYTFDNGQIEPIETTGTIEIIEPFESEVWLLGEENVPIIWSTGDIGGNVKIELYTSEGYERLIAASVENNGYYDEYDVPSDLIPDIDYQIKITPLDNPSLAAYSDFFEIRSTSTDPFEPNNSRTEAYAVTLTGDPASWQSGPGPEINPVDDEDWFMLTANPGDELTISCDVTSALDAELMLYHDNVYVDGSDVSISGGNEGIVYIVPENEGGTYYIGIQYFTSPAQAEKTRIMANTGSYELSVEIEHTSSDPFEPNDTRDEAYEISLTGSPLSWDSGPGPEIDPSTDQDWFEFDASSGDELTIFCEVGSNLDPEIVLYYSGERVARIDNGAIGTDETLTYTVPSGESGTYYAGIGFYSNISKASRVMATTGTYELSIEKVTLTTDPYEPNNTRSTAYNISPDPTWDSDAGVEINPSDDKDWFNLYAYAGDQLNILCTVDSNLDPEIVLYHNDERVDNEDAHASGYDETMTYTVTEEGNYYIGIGYYSNISKMNRIMASTGTYQLHVEQISLSSDPYEPNETMNDAYSIYLSGSPATWSSSAGTEIDPSTDQDWFEFYASAGDELTLLCEVDSNLDVEIVLYYNGERVARKDSHGSGSDETLAYTVPSGESGTYYAGIGYYGNISKSTRMMANTGTYAFTVTREEALDPLTVTITSPSDGATLTTNVVTVSGTVDDNSVSQATLTINGTSQTIAVSGGSFSNQAILSSGSNTIRVDASNSSGQSGYDEITVNCQIATVDIRVTLTWNTSGTDLDLWVTDPNGETVKFSNKVSEIGGELDVDNRSGYGPENFTLEAGEAISGTYSVVVDYWSGNIPSSATVTILLHEGQWNEEVLTFGPHEFNYSDTGNWEVTEFSWP